MRKLFVTTVIASCFAINAQSQIYLGKKGEVKINFFSETPIENITAENTSAASSINGDSVKIVIPNKGFIFPKPLMQEHFNENYMESEKYPKSSFKGKLSEKIDFTKDGTQAINCVGTMNIHGVEKTVTLPGTITIKGDEVTIVSAFKVKLDDYKITRPKVVMSQIAEDIDVKINAVYAPYKKQ
jgi:hypothetical protein